VLLAAVATDGARRACWAQTFLLLLLLLLLLQAARLCCMLWAALWEMREQVSRNAWVTRLLTYVSKLAPA
jgi:hypothetical protein